MVNVTVEARNDAGNPGVVKLQGDTWELNVWATTDELWKLAGLRSLTRASAIADGTVSRPPAMRITRLNVTMPAAVSAIQESA